MIRILSAVLLAIITFAPIASGQAVVYRTNIPNPERAQIIHEAQDAQKKAADQSQRYYRNQKRFASKQRHMQIDLEEKFYVQVCKRHRISHTQMITIMSEGIRAEQQRQFKAASDPNKTVGDGGKGKKG